MNRSATPSSTMKRLALTQLWPTLMKRALTAAAAASSTSASASTINGSEPPSSRTCFLSARPACDATMLPTWVEPCQGHGGNAVVGDQACNLVGLDQQGTEQPIRRPSIPHDLLDGHGALGDVVGVLKDRAVAGGKGRGGETEELPERVVPRHDGQHHAERIEHDRCFRWRCWPRPHPPGSLVPRQRRSRSSRRTSRSRPRPPAGACPSPG